MKKGIFIVLFISLSVAHVATAAVWVDILFVLLFAGILINYICVGDIQINGPREGRDEDSGHKKRNIIFLLIILGLMVLSLVFSKSRKKVDVPVVAKPMTSSVPSQPIPPTDSSQKPVEQEKPSEPKP